MARKITTDDLLSLSLAGEPQLSPDGRKVAFVVARIDREKNEYRHRIYMMDARPEASPVAFTGGPKSDRNPRWSPDGASLAFISDRSGKDQVWVMGAFGGEGRQLTRFKDGVSGPPVWSPDSKQIAFTATVSAEGPKSEDEKDDESDLFKKYTKDVRRITRIHYKLDGQGIFDERRHAQIFSIALGDETPEARQITRGPWNHETPAWAPDGQAMAFVANRRVDNDYVPYLSDIWVQDLTLPGAEPHRVTPDGMGTDSPAWSPDGKQIAFAGHDYMPFQGYSSTRLYVVNGDGTGLRRVAQTWDRTFSGAVVADTPAPAGGRLRWSPDGRALLSLGACEGQQQVYWIDLSGDSVIALTKGEHCVTSWSADSKAETVVVGLTRPDLPADLFLLEDNELVRLTNLNEALLSEVELATVEHFRFTTGGGDNPFLQSHGHEGLLETDGWVMKPPGFVEGNKYPAVLQIHGGPMGMYGWTFFMEFQCLAAEGYAVVYTNPRGSQGYSERFCACIKEDWGNLDYLDVMAGLDEALARNPWLDSERVGIAGGSYGGFMVNWAIGQTDRFKAAVTMRSCVNESSMVGTSDFGFVDMATYPSRPWDDLTFYKRVSPLTFVAQMHTPLLIEHQENDLRCPMEQAEQLYTALKVLRRTVEFVRYPESSHGMSRTGKPWLRVHRLRTILGWFSQHIERLG